MKSDEAFYHALIGLLKWRQKEVKGGLEDGEGRIVIILFGTVLFDKGGEELKECLRFALGEYFKKNRFLKGDRLVVIITAILWVMHKDELDWDLLVKYPTLNNVDRTS